MTKKSEQPGPGHNSGAAGEQLQIFLERYERLDEEKKTIAEDMKDVMLELKGQGFDTKIFKRIIAVRKRDQSEIQEEEAIFKLYCQALGITTFDVI